MHVYADARQYFPPGYSNVSNSCGWLWGTHILPGLETTSLHDKFSPSSTTVYNYSTIADLQAPSSTFRCPSDPSFTDIFPSPAPRRLFSIAAGSNIRVAMSNYAGNNGSWRANSSARFVPFVMVPGAPGVPAAITTTTSPNGIFWRDSDLKLKDITDGLSKTIMVGERSINSQALANQCPGAACIYAGGFSNQLNDLDVALGTATVPLNSTNGDYGSRGFRSEHSGGLIQFLFCDGSVKAISDGINHTTMRVYGAAGPWSTFEQLMSRNDGQAITGDY
jgi:prepilin-type processing-associated H-X9-DG protein